MNPGTTCTKMSQNGVNPRPAGLPLQHSIMQLCGTWLEPTIKVTPMWFRQNLRVKPERFESIGVDPKSNDNPKIQNPTQLEEQCGPCKQRARATEARAELKPGRPASNCIRWSHATATDFRRRSRASTQRRWQDGHIPRPAGLGEAGRPHQAASTALPWRGRQAQLPYLRATNAQLSTDHRVV